MGITIACILFLSRSISRVREYSLAEGVLDVFVGRPLPERTWTDLGDNLMKLVSDCCQWVSPTP